MNYPRRQQYGRLSRAAATAMASAAAVMLALTAATPGAASAAGVLLVVALAFGVYAHHWRSLAERSGVGARSEDEVRHALAPLQADGWRLHHSLPWRGRGDIDSLAIAPTGVAFVDETKTLGCASRRRGCLAGVDGGAGAGRCRWSAWFAHAASSGLSGTFWRSRSIG
ncbi:MAG: nuclease-related domain-containing protein [Solirubrobacteraceae bacterium]